MLFIIWKGFVVPKKTIKALLVPTDNVGPIYLAFVDGKKTYVIQRGTEKIRSERWPDKLLVQHKQSLKIQTSQSSFIRLSLNDTKKLIALAKKREQIERQISRACKILLNRHELK